MKLKRWDTAIRFAKNALILCDALYGKRGKNIHTYLKNEGTIDAKLFGEWRVKSYLVIARSSMEEERIDDAVAILKKAWSVATGYMEEMNGKGQSRNKEENASLKSLKSQVKEIRRLLVECSDKKKASKKLEQRRAKAMFGEVGGKSPSTAVNNNIDAHQQKKKTEEAKENDTVDVSTELSQTSEIDADRIQRNKQRKSSTDGSEEKKELTDWESASFSERVSRVTEADGEKEASPWYSEHKEALILLAIAGFSAAAVISLRRSFR